MISFKKNLLAFLFVIEFEPKITNISQETWQKIEDPINTGCKLKLINNPRPDRPVRE